jgi:hypothetical protein
MKGIGRYVIKLPQDFDLKNYEDKVGENTIYKAAQFGADTEHLIQHTELAAVPDSEKFLKPSDVVYMTHGFFDRLYQFKTKENFFASIVEDEWNGDNRKDIDSRVMFPLALFVLRGKKTKALYENNICDIVYRDGDPLSPNRKPFAQRAKVTDSRTHKKKTTILFLKDSDYHINLGVVELLCIPERWVFGTFEDGKVNLKEGWNSVRAIDGEEWKKHRSGYFVQAKDLQDKGIGEVVDGEFAGKTVLFKKKYKLEETDNEELFVCKDTQIYCTLDKYEGV